MKFSSSSGQNYWYDPETGLAFPIPDVLEPSLDEKPYDSTFLPDYASTEDHEYYARFLKKINISDLSQEHFRFRK